MASLGLIRLGVGGVLGTAWLELLGTFGYRIAAIGLCSATGLRCFSSSSGGVGSSGSALSKLVADPALGDLALMVRGGWVGFVIVIIVGTALVRRCGSRQIGVSGDSGGLDPEGL